MARSPNPVPLACVSARRHSPTACPSGTLPSPPRPLTSPAGLTSPAAAPAPVLFPCTLRAGPEQVVKLLANPLRPVPQCGRGPAQAASKQTKANKSKYKAITSSNMFKSDKKPAFGRVSRRGASRLFSGPDPPPPRPYTRGEGGHPAFRLQAPGHGGTVPGGRGLHARMRGLTCPPLLYPTTGN